jgi:hypothetical protein
MRGPQSFAHARIPAAQHSSGDKADTVEHLGTQSMTAKATAAPSSVGSMCTPKGRSPQGVSTTQGDGAGDPAGIGVLWHDSLKKHRGSAARNPHMGRLVFRGAPNPPDVRMGEIIRT